MKRLLAALAGWLVLQGATAVPPPGALLPSNDVDVQDRLPGHPTIGEATWELRPPRPLTRDAAQKPQGTSESHVVCDLDELVAKSGDAFVAHVYTMDFDCISELFDNAPIAIRTAAFREANVIHLAQATGAAATDDGIGTLTLHKLFYFLQASRYVNYSLRNGSNDLGWSSVVQPTILAAVDSFVGSTRFRDDETGDTGNVITAVILVIDGPGDRARYLPVVVDWMSRWNADRARVDGQRRAMAAAMRLVFNAHSERSFEAVVASLPIVDVLRDLALSDWMLGTDAESIVSSAAGELARFLRSDLRGLRFHEDVRTAVRQVLDRYDPLGQGASVWARAAGAVVSFELCSAFAGVCERISTLEDDVLNVEHRCNEGVLIRGQDLDESLLDVACRALRDQEATFHWRLKTDPRQPVANDYTAAYEVVAFADWDNYNTYSGLFFGNDTDNGGIYLEGDPSRRDNVARHLGYASGAPARPIWNLRHEYVHHLDARYNLYGNFGDARVGTHKTVWWIEGLAEYLSWRDDNDAAIELAQTYALTLDEVMHATYSNGVDRVYRWPYLAVRFMLEEHRGRVNDLLSLLRQGDYDGYLRRVNGPFVADLEPAWREWLGGVEAIEDYDIGTLPITLPEVLETYEDESGRFVVDVGQEHPTGEGIVVEAHSSDPDIVTASRSGSVLTVAAVSPGTATVTVTIGDTWGSITRTFDLTVADCPAWLCRPFVGGWRMALLSGDLLRER